MARAATAPARPARTPAPAPAPRRRPTVVTRQRRRRRARFRLRLGLATIPLVAVLFAGVIYVNSAELRVTKRQGEVVRRTAVVQGQIDMARAAQAKRDAVVRTRAEELGMVTPNSDDLHYIEARPAAP